MRLVGMQGIHFVPLNVLVFLYKQTLTEHALQPPVLRTSVGEKAAPRSSVPIGCHATADAFAGSTKINTYYVGWPVLSPRLGVHMCHAANCKQMKT
jgi:hypothetical protein